MIRPDHFVAFQLIQAALRAVLERAPKESIQLVRFSQNIINLPMPDGTLARFRFVESPIMPDELGAKFPEIRTYLGQGIDEPSATVRFDITPGGFHAQILSPNGAVYIDPYFKGDPNIHISYYKRDYRRAATFQCFAPTGDSMFAAGPQIAPLTTSAGNLRTYRLACAATGEYTQYQGGTVAAGMAAIVIAINRVTGVYETEAGIRLVLVTNNDKIVYTNASTDPYSNNSGSTMLNQNQSNIDTVIGSANYDIGHVFSTGGGGIAGLGVVCVGGRKANGVTGLPDPIDDAFYIDYVAHEMGHQFGANHTFNSSLGSCGGGNRNASTAYEPGSASTIMGYAGICDTDDLQPHSDPYFHSVSLDEIVNYTTSGSGSGCAVVTANGNIAPSVSPGPNYTIPKGTPFMLTASGSDANGDSLTFCWEERDLGPSITLTNPDNGSSPLFRSFNPTSEPSRTFPQLSDVLAHTNTLGEMLPTTSRTMTFRVVARDNRAGGGGFNTADMQVSVNSNAGPFVVTSPNANVTWSGVQTVTWNVAGTAASPIFATNVNILLSTNSGLSFPFALATNVANNGAASVTLPDVATATARIKVQAAANIFFDISDVDFSVLPVVHAPAVTIDSTTLAMETCVSSNNAIDPNETVTVNFALKNTGNLDTTNLVVSLLATNGISAPSAAQNYGALLAGGPSVSRPFTFMAQGPCAGAITAVLQLQDGGTNLPAVYQPFILGSTAFSSSSWTNPASMDLPASSSTRAASIYPSPIAVSNLSGTISKVTVSLVGLSHSLPSDLDVLLVGPSGQTVMLMSDAGTTPITNLNLTFDDAASVSLPATGALVSGVYKPTNFDTSTDAFPVPAPAGPYGATLSALNSTVPNGNWSLYIQDDTKPNVGTLAQGWTLSIVTSNTTCCANSADLAIGQSVSPPVVNVGSHINFTLVITNSGPDAAGNVVVTDTLPDQFSLDTVALSQGSWSYSSGVVSAVLGLVPSGSSVTMDISAVATNTGICTNLAIVSGVTPDPNSANNSISSLAQVNPQNHAPSLAPINDFALNEGSQLIFTNSASDPDSPGQTLTFSLSNAPPGSLIDTNTGVFSWIPSEAQGPRDYTITVIVSDNGSPVLTDQKTFNVNVSEVNSAPILMPIADQVVIEGQTLLVTNSAIDPDIPANLLSFSLGTNAPDGVSINPTNGLITWTPTEAQGPATNQIIVIVTDDGFPPMQASRPFTVTVLETNSAPILTPIADQQVIEGQTLFISNSASDADIPTNMLAYSLGTNAPVGMAINATNGLIIWTPTEAQGPATNVVSVIVTDNGVPPLQAVQTFTVTVLETNSPPTLLPIADQVVVEGQNLILTNSASDADIPTNILTFSLGTNAPEGMTINSSNGLVTWTPSEFQGSTTNVVSVSVTDNGVPPMQAVQTFTVTVLKTNSPPALMPIADQVVIEGQMLMVTNSATDPDIPTNILAFTLGTNAPAGMSINASNGLITWTPTEAQGPATNLVSVIVTDNGTPALSATRVFIVVVLETNSAPTLLAISDRIIHAGTTLMVSNSATDPDIPTNALAFSLGAGAPPSATIDPVSGLLSWATTDANANTTNHIEVVVNDNGVPNLADQKSFDVIVVERPLLMISVVSNQAVNLVWTSIAGQQYSLQYVENLTGTNWSNLAGALTATGPSTQTNDVLNPVVQRFYRVKVLP